MYCVTPYQVEIKYRATKQTKKGAARDAETIPVNDVQGFARCKWGQHTNCSVSDRGIVKIAPKLINLRSYCEVGKERAYDYLYDETGQHVLNVKVSPKHHCQTSPVKCQHQLLASLTHLLQLVDILRGVLA